MRFSSSSALSVDDRESRETASIQTTKVSCFLVKVIQIPPKRGCKHMEESNPMENLLRQHMEANLACVCFNWGVHACSALNYITPRLLKATIYRIRQGIVTIFFKWHLHEERDPAGTKIVSCLPTARIADARGRNPRYLRHTQPFHPSHGRFVPSLVLAAIACSMPPLSHRCPDRQPQKSNPGAVLIA